MEAPGLVDPGKPESSVVAINFSGLAKSFGSVKAVEDVSFRVHKGSVHAILGENGAGKTTLMRLLAGVLQPDSGWFEVDGNRAIIRNPKDARRLGIGMVHQHLALLPSLTVAENLYLDDDQARNLFKPREYGQSLALVASRFGVRVAADRPVWQLTTAERQVLEIARILMHRCSILVLDEPTAHLSPIEGDRLLDQLRELAHQGATVLLVTHKLREIEKFADRVTVLRRGKHVLTARVDSTSPSMLAQAMVGEKAPGGALNALRFQCAHGETIVRARDLSVRGRHGEVVTGGISFEVARGEILGVAGISGNGQEELAGVLARLSPPAGGELSFCTRLAPVIAFVPADKFGVGAPRELTVAENLTLRDYRRPEFRPGGLVDREELRRLAASRRSRFQIDAPDLDAPTGELSGGNVQRVILARELSQEFDLLVAHNPTAGLDIAGASFVRQVVCEAASRGAAVILISDDLDEILGMTDRVVILGRGRSEGVHQTSEIDRSLFGRLMLCTTYAATAQDPIR